jgi:dipeptidyl-peptidase-4
MNKKSTSSKAALGLVILALAAVAYGAGSQSDYDRSEKLSSLTRNKVFRNSVEPNWQKDNKTFWYKVNTSAKTCEYVFVDAEKGSRKLAFDHKKLAKALKKNGIDDADASSLKLEKLIFDRTKGTLTFDGYGKTWQCDLRGYKLNSLTDAAMQSLPAYALKDAPKARQGNGKDTAITFVNDTKDTVELFWLNADGERTSYGKLKPAQQYTQNTYAGHLWMAAKLDSTPIAVYQAKDKKSKAVVGIELTKPKQPAKKKRTAKARPPKAPGQVSPDGKFAAFIKEHNLWVRDVSTKKETRLSTDGTDDNSYTGQIKWSPDSKKIAVIRQKKAVPHKVYIVESTPKDQLQPKLHTLDYHKPGDQLAVNQPRLFNVENLKELPVANDLFKNPWSISHMRWRPDSSHFTFLYNQRGHQVLRIVAVNAETGKASAIVDETSKTFVDYSGKMFYEQFDDTGEIIWQSERDGYNHLYLFDSIKGKVKNQITKGNWVVRGIDKVDKENRQIWFRAGGIYPGQDPYYLHYCRVNFDGTGLTILTEGDGTHSVTFSPDRKYFIDKYSRIDMPPVHELRQSKDGKLVCKLEKADWSELLKTGWQIPERFVARARDGKADIYGMILRPTNFDPEQTYPIIENIYAGPQSAFVPKAFSEYWRMNKIAELGFIVVKMDGMGTSQRSKAFHDVCYQNLIDSGLPDRIKWIKAAAEKYPYMDTSRVGIYGGSAGGQNSTAAVLTHPEFYKVAVSDCGCHDNRMDKVWWNEQWMGQMGPHYEANSNMTHAHKLQGKLMLTVGEMDKNVDPATTMQLAAALIKADKDFDLIVFPGGGHGSGGSKYGARRREDFFIRHLHGKEPRTNQ